MIARGGWEKSIPRVMLGQGPVMMGLRDEKSWHFEVYVIYVDEHVTNSIGCVGPQMYSVQRTHSTSLYI
jgi:hypothetical protein